MMYICPKVTPAHHAEAFRVEVELGPRAQACNAAERNRGQVHLGQNKMKRRFIEKSGDPLTILKKVHLQVGLFQELFFAAKLQQGKL